MSARILAHWLIGERAKQVRRGALIAKKQKVPGDNDDFHNFHTGESSN